MSDVMSPHGASAGLGDTPIGHAVQMRERMRALIHSEVETINPTDDARRALELIIESAVRPSSVDGDLKLTVIDAQGQPRVIEKNGETVAFTLQDLLAELRAMHPVLFKPQPQPAKPDEDRPTLPQDTVAPKQKPPRDWLTLDADDAAPRDKPNPLLGARVLAHWRGGMVRFHGWSKRLSGRSLKAAAALDNPRVTSLRKGLSDSKDRAQAILDSLQEKPVSRRPGFALGAVALALLVLGGGAFLLLSRDQTTPGISAQASAEEPTETGALASSQVASTQAPPAPPTDARTLRGVPEVIDTATLSLEGEVVRLFGVEWAPGAGKPDDLTVYLQGRDVTCEPAGGNDTYRCKVGEQDLSRVILYNGGGQPTAQATPELKAAAAHAREAKIGVWGKP